jgi:hypothetical protein
MDLNCPVQLGSESNDSRPSGRGCMGCGADRFVITTSCSFSGRLGVAGRFNEDDADGRPLRAVNLQRGTSHGSRLRRAAR